MESLTVGQAWPADRFQGPRHQLYQGIKHVWVIYGKILVELCSALPRHPEELVVPTAA